MKVQWDITIPFWNLVCCYFNTLQETFANCLILVVARSALAEVLIRIFDHNVMFWQNRSLVLLSPFLPRNKLTGIIAKYADPVK